MELAANTREAFSIMPVKNSPSPRGVDDEINIRRQIGNVTKFYTRV
jgi:hypothetical protein